VIHRPGEGGDSQARRGRGFTGQEREGIHRPGEGGDTQAGRGRGFTGQEREVIQFGEGGDIIWIMD